MASAQDMEEQLQQSVMVSEDEAAYDTADGTPGPDPQSEPGDGEEESDRDASGEEVDDYEEEYAKDDDDEEIVVARRVNGVQDHDASGEDDDDDDDEQNARGAVKVQPGASDEDEDEEEEEEASSNAESDSSENEDEDEEAGWEEREAGDEDADEESDAAPSSICLFCKQPEENDPSEDFEAFLTCTGCNENAHQQCARDEDALTDTNGPKEWKCPTCYSEDSELEEDEAEDESASVSQGETGGPRASRSTSRSNRSTRSIPDDAASQRKSKKRRTSSLEPDEQVVSLRKRRRRPSDATEAPEDSTRSSRTSRIKVDSGPAVTVQKKSRTSLILMFKVRPGNLKEFMSRKKRDRRPNGANRTPRPSAVRLPVPRSAAPTPVVNDTPLFPTPFTSDSYSTPFYSFFDRETDGVSGKPYGGILNDSEADTSKTLPTTEDRRRFDHAKQRAEEEWRARVLAMRAEAVAPVRKPRKANDHASQIECIEFGGWEVDTWYAAPYPAEYSRNRVLYICEFCLKYMNSDYVAWRHKMKCATKHPPGDEIYRDGSVSVFEVDGRKNPVYCQNLCLLAKLFLGSKTLYYDVEPFLFYVLCEYDDCGYHFVGYFSKEKRASSQNNVSCILTLPIHQRKGYGNLLIDFSYLLTRVEEKTGSPEKPLSDMGLVSYRNYWRLILCRYFLDTMEKPDHEKDGLSVKQISDDTGMTPDDVISALEGLRALVRDPQTKTYAFRVDLDYCRQYVDKWESKGYVKLRPEALVWTPYVMGRSNAVNFELGPPISTVAPRDDDEPKPVENVHLETEAETTNGVAETPEVENAPAESEDAAEDTTSKPDVEQPVEDKENTAPDETHNLDEDDPEAWRVPYNDIPPSRFEIFPPPTGGRRNDRPRSVGRPTVGRSGNGSARPKRPSGSRRSTGSRPRPSSSKRKSGGTGRGPGRWPKGTKKSDYGNATSGPGLPPGWKKAEVAGEEVAQDVVQVTVRPSAESDAKMVNGGATAGEVEVEEDAEGEDA